MSVAVMHQSDSSV